LETAVTEGLATVQGLPGFFFLSASTCYAFLIPVRIPPIIWCTMASWPGLLYPCDRCAADARSVTIACLPRAVRIQRTDGKWSCRKNTICLCCSCAQEWRENLPRWMRLAEPTAILSSDEMLYDVAKLM
jgi:hypothetical protein